jgi:DNA uptake protein ComE-like DNA-binding protein
VRKLKLWIKGFFGFSRAETNAFLILIPLMFLLIFSESVFQYWYVRQPSDYSNEKHELDSLIATMEWPSDSAALPVGAKARELFAFDPNLATKEDFMELGFNQSLSKRIINYRAKGGKFIIKRDLKKIYGMDSGFFQKVSPYIQLPEIIVEPKRNKPETKQKPNFSKFDLNTADSSQLISVYGIGPKLAKRIIAYRTKLGGFILARQLTEVYGLDSTARKQLLERTFISENFQPEKINLNTVNERDLAAHPYVKYKLAKAIIAFRAQHGAFNTVDDLKKIAIMQEADIEKIRPYLSN